MEDYEIYKELHKEEIAQKNSSEVKRFLDEFRKRTIGIYDEERVFYILEKMKDDTGYQLSDDFTNHVQEMIENKDSIENIYNEVMLPLENYHHELVDGVKKSKDEIDSIIEDQQQPDLIQYEIPIIEVSPEGNQLTEEDGISENKEQSSTIMKGIELELSSSNQVTPMEIVQIPDTALDIEQVKKDEKEKTYVKQQPSPKSDNTAGNANIIILYFILFVQITSLVGVFLLLK